MPDLAARLPDRPRWVEIRSILLSGAGQIIGAVSLEPLTFVVMDTLGELAGVVGRPSPVDVQAAAATAPELLAFDDNAAHVQRCLPGWICERALLFERLRVGSSISSDGIDAKAGRSSVRLLEAIEVDRLAEARQPAAVPPELVEELRHAVRSGSPIAAAYSEALPVSFCYPTSVTEGLWDVSIDTLTAFRRQGHAEAAASFMIDYWAARGRQPVWGAVESNLASRRLATKLGFAQTDALWVVSRPG